MSAVTIEPRAVAVKRALKRLAAMLADMRPVYEEIGERLADSTRGRFLGSRGPTGRPWKRSKLAKRERRRTLIRSGRLYGSIRADASDSGVRVGTDMPHGAVHQAGGRLSAERQGAAARKSGARGLGGLPAPNVGAVVRAGIRAATRSARTRRRPARRSVRLPPRPFLGISKADRRALAAIVLERAERAWR